MVKSNLIKYDNLELMEKKIHHLLGARLRDKDRIREAVQKQNEIKSRHTSVKKWDSVSEIRKWRETK